MAARKDFQRVIREAQRQGWSVERTNGGHVRFRNPAGQSYFTGSSPSDFRAVRKLVADLRKMGYRDDTRNHLKKDKRDDEP